ncbi:competence protein ComEC [Pedobacter sp. CG_S7]|uniref:ComEC/Rec2 family competence protein n=1 Tax=Pedobacter sp. CG_S7 TaxID=3143930 RepID=UPI003399C225
MSIRAETVFVNLLFFYIAGIYVAYEFASVGLQWGFAFSSFLLFAFLVILNNRYAKLKAYRYKIYTSALFYLLFFCVGGWLYLINSNNLQPGYFAKTKLDAIKIILEETPQWKGNQVRFKAKVIYGYQAKRGIACQGRLLVTLNAGKHKPITLNYGDELILPAHYRAVETPQNPSEFDYKAWLATQNIHYQVYMNQQDAILTGQNRGNTLIAFALTLRLQQIEHLKKLIVDQEAFSVASTLILGYRADLSKETLAAYSKTGTIHALSVSGMHVGIIYIVLMWSLRFMNRSTLLKILKAILIIALIWFYALVTGFSPSVLRSAIMLTCFIIAKTGRKRTNSYNILAFSAFILLVYQPFLLFDVGFQLSYLAVFGLIYLQPLLYNLLYFKYTLADKLWQFTALSLAAQLATFPLSVYYFHQFPVYFLLSNLFIMLPASLMMYLGLSMLLFRLYFLAPLLEWVINLTNTGLKWIASLPFSTISAIWWNKTALILLLVFLILFILALNKAQKKLLFPALCTLLIFQSILSFYKMQALRQQKTITFKLRRNYAVAYLYSNRAILFTDVDPESKVFQYSIKPCLDQHQVKEIQFKNGLPDLNKIKHLW